MSKTALYLVHIEPAPHSDLDDVKHILNLAEDWHVLGVSEDQWCFVISSSLETGFWLDALMPHVESEGELFVGKLVASQIVGWKPDSFWKWLRNQSKG